MNWEPVGRGIRLPREVRRRKPADWRRALPELDSLQATDEAIAQAEPLLYGMLAQGRVCGDCRGYENCGKIGDARGMTDRLAVQGGRLTIRTGHCRPYLDYLAVRKANRFAQFSSRTAHDRSQTFSNFPREQRLRRPKLFAAVEAFANGYEAGKEESGFYIFGPAGVGKTHLLNAMANRLEERRVPFILIRAEALFDRLRSSLADGRDIEPALEAFSSVPVLFLDEIGQERANEFSLEKLFRIVNYRFSAKLPTVCASNYAPPDLYSRLHDSMTPVVDPLKSRLIGMSRVAYLDGDDFRLSHMELLDV